MSSAEIASGLRAARSGLDRIEQALAAEPAACGSALRLARNLIDQRRHRDETFPPGFFSDPRWDVLLVLFAAYEEGREVRFIDAFNAAGVPHATGTRAINELEQAGFVATHRPGEWRQKRLVQLTEEGAKRMRRTLLG